MVDFSRPHRRFNPLTREWVLVSPQRASRPWQGQVEPAPAEALPPYDPQCYLCPGNMRAGGKRNPHYTSTFVFDNDFAALLPPGDDVASRRTPAENFSGLLRAEDEAGICRVVCFSPRHDLTIPQMPLAQVEAVVKTWSEETRALSGFPFIGYVQVFENKGAAMGCSNPHPHSQIWATAHLPNEPAKELTSQAEYRQQSRSCLLCDYVAMEMQKGERLVAANEHFAAFVPFWAIWPFEVLLVGRRHVATLPELTAAEVGGLAALLQEVTGRYDRLFKVSFPYSMGFHQAPVNHLAAAAPEGVSAWHLHVHFYPPLLRSATVKKFMVGYEMLAMPQRDLTPESAAERLRLIGRQGEEHGTEQRSPS